MMQVLLRRTLSLRASRVDTTRLLRAYHSRGVVSLAHLPLQVHVVAQKHFLRKRQQRMHDDWFALVSQTQRLFPRCLATSHVRVFVICMHACDVVNLYACVLTLVVLLLLLLLLLLLW